MRIEQEARQQFAEKVAATLDRICADLGITAENAHEHELRQWTTPGGQWHYYVDGELVMVVDPATNWIEGRIENRAYRESRARESETEQQWSDRASQAISFYGGESAHTKRVPIFRSSFFRHTEGPMTEHPPKTGDISPRTAAFASPGARPMDNLPQPGWRARIRMRLRTLFSRWTSGV